MIGSDLFADFVTGVMKYKDVSVFQTPGGAISLARYLHNFPIIQIHPFRQMFLFTN